MKVCVTGAGGFVGSHLVSKLAARGDNVVAVDVNDTALERHDRVESRIGDIRDVDFLTRTLQETSPDLVYHMAALVGVSVYIDRPFDVLDVNVFGTRNILEACLQTTTPCVLASTSEVYGKNPRVPWSEDDDRVLGGTQVDRWSYSTSKAAAEHLGLAVHKSTGLPVSIVRYFNAYGPRQVPNFVISKSIHRALNGRPPLVYDGGEQTRCFTFIDDVVAGTIAVGDSDQARGEVFNIGSEMETTIRNAVDVVITATGYEGDVENLDTGRHYGDSYQDIDRRIPSAAKAREMLGWTATTDLTEGVEATVSWARSNPQWLDQN